MIFDLHPYQARHRAPKTPSKILSGSSKARAFWNLADQAVSSLSNAVMSIVAARLTTQTDFGRFAVAFSLYSFTVGISKALAATPFVIASTGADDKEARRDGASGAGLSLVVGLVLTALIGLAALVLHNAFTLPVAMMAIALPGLFLQDFIRTALIARGRPAGATVNDSLWVVAAAAAIAGVLAIGDAKPWSLIVAWAIGGWLAAALGLAQWGARPRLKGAAQHLKGSWNTTRFLLWEYLAVSGATQAVWLIVPLVAGAAAVGAVRGGLTLLGPLYIASTALGTFGLTELLRSGRPHVGRARQVAVILTLVIAALDVVWAGALLLMPAAWGHNLLGDTWTNARATLIPLTVNNVAIAASTGPMIAMRAYADTKRTFRVYLGFGPAMLVCALIGAAMAGGQGAAWGYAVSAVLYAPAWWITLRSSLAEQQRLHPEISED